MKYKKATVGRGLLSWLLGCGWGAGGGSGWPNSGPKKPDFCRIWDDLRLGADRLSASDL